MECWENKLFNKLYPFITSHVLDTLSSWATNKSAIHHKERNKSWVDWEHLKRWINATHKRWKGEIKHISFHFIISYCSTLLIIFRRELISSEWIGNKKSSEVKCNKENDGNNRKCWIQSESKIFFIFSKSFEPCSITIEKLTLIGVSILANGQHNNWTWLCSCSTIFQVQNIIRQKTLTENKIFRFSLFNLFLANIRSIYWNLWQTLFWLLFFLFHFYLINELIYHELENIDNMKWKVIII